MYSIRKILSFIVLCSLSLPAVSDEAIGVAFGEDTLSINIHSSLDNNLIDLGFTLHGSHDYLVHHLSDDWIGLSKDKYFSLGLGPVLTTFEILRPYAFLEYYSDINASNEGLTGSVGLILGELTEPGLALDIGYRGKIEQAQLGFIYRF